MSFLSKIKQFFSKEEEQQEIKKEEISLSSLAEKLKADYNSIEKEKQELKKQVLEQVKSFISQLKSRIEFLKNINIDKRKEQEKIKLIVKENFKLYLEYLKNLIHNLEKAENQDDYFKKISDIFNFFNKSANPAFEKSTLLIGDELGKTKELINSFQKSLLIFLKDNEKLEEKAKKISSVQLNLGKKEEIEQILKNSNDNIENLKSAIEEAEKKKEKLEVEISDLKNSQDYKKIKEEKASKLAEQERNLESIKKKIDFKALSKIYHTIEKKNNLVKAYNDNFKLALEQDKNLELIELAKSINLDISYIKEIKDKISELSNEKPAEIEISIKNAEDNFKSLENHLDKNKVFIEEENRKIKKMKEKQSILSEEIKEQSNSIDIAIRD